MGAEELVKKRIRKGNIQQAILKTVAFAGLMGVALVAPKVLKAFYPKGKKIKRFLAGNINRSRDTLLDKGYMEFVDTPKGKEFRLTQRGKIYLRKLEASDYDISKPKKWDGLFRIVTFDIKEPRKGIRDKLRKTLKQIGFYQLQRSVWVYPHDCEELVTMLKADYKIGKEVLYVIANHIEFDKPLREHFFLPVPH